MNTNANPISSKPSVDNAAWKEIVLKYQKPSVWRALWQIANTIIPFSNWQGPVWPIANYFYFVALLQHGFRQEAAELVRRLTRLYLRDIAFCGSLHENYCAETGASLAPSAAQSKQGLEGGFVGWNLLLQDMIEMLDGRPHLLTLHP